MSLLKVFQSRLLTAHDEQFAPVRGARKDFATLGGYQDEVLDMKNGAVADSIHGLNSQGHAFLQDGFIEGVQHRFFVETQP